MHDDDGISNSTNDNDNTVEESEPILQHTTPDESKIVLSNDFAMLKIPFPWKLFQLLEDAEKNGKQSIISWLPEGDGFSIFKSAEFASQIMKSYFVFNGYESFTHELDRYAFTITRENTSQTETFRNKRYTRNDKALSLALRRKCTPRKLSDRLVARKTSVKHDGKGDIKFSRAPRGSQKQQHPLKNSLRSIMGHNNNAGLEPHFNNPFGSFLDDMTLMRLWNQNEESRQPGSNAHLMDPPYQQGGCSSGDGVGKQYQVGGVQDFQGGNTSTVGWTAPSTRNILGTPVEHLFEPHPPVPTQPSPSQSAEFQTILLYLEPRPMLEHTNIEPNEIDYTFE